MKKRDRVRNVKKEFNLDYTSIHKYIREIKKKPKVCSICNERKKLELACIEHQYSKDSEDYIWLCRGCHLLYDNCRKKRMIEIEC
ncbi:MAG: hypothetical protein EU531_10945 [Promethearchaeota archaeon]|nr:MAG: hypothetical protein EU531_10945 [Candidatus Lokiarchaeota archaeon]